MIENFYTLPEKRDLNKINSNGHEYVDLDLPSGTLWSTQGIFDEKIPGIKGFDFKLGSLTPPLTRFCNYNPKILDLVYKNELGELKLPDNLDIAKHWMGGDWRLPKKEDILELKIFTNKQYIYESKNKTYIKCSSIINPEKYIIFKIESKYIHDINNYLTSSLKNIGPGLVYTSYNFSKPQDPNDTDLLHVTYSDYRSLGCVRGVI